jgi:hypothetical protein
MVQQRAFDAGFVSGEAQGQREALAQLDTAVAHRMGGGMDVVMPEDVERARKGLLH